MMSDLNIVDVAQGSEEWLESRKGKVTGSRVGALLGLSPYQSPDELLEEMLNELHGEKPHKPTPAMKWGSLHEKDGVAHYKRQRYRERQCPHRELKHVGQVIHPTYDWIRYSPDGLVVEGVRDGKGVMAIEETEVVGLIEVKAPYSQNIPAEPPPHYIAQVQLGMEVLGVDWCDFIYWTPAKSVVKRIEREEEWFSEHIGTLQSFYNTLTTAMEFNAKAMEV